MITVWLVASFAGCAAIAMIVRRYGRGRHTDLGFVSQRWVAEQRLSQQHEPQR